MKLLELVCAQSTQLANRTALLRFLVATACGRNSWALEGVHTNTYFEVYTGLLLFCVRDSWVLTLKRVNR